MKEAAIVQSQTDQALGALLTLPPPRIAPERLAAALAEHWGLRGQCSPLSGERDLNFRLKTEAGSYLVKLAHSAESAELTAFQNEALNHLAMADPGLPVSRTVPSDAAPWINLPEGRLRVLSWLEGTPMYMSSPSTPQAKAVGATLARLAQALEGFSHVASDRTLLWDIRQAHLLAPLISAIEDPDLRRDAEEFVDRFARDIAPRLQELPWQVCHNDFNRHNLLVDADTPSRIIGVLDFGDMVRTPRICDLAVAASYQVVPGQILDQLCAVLAGYAARQPLLSDEIALLYDLVQARMITSLAIGSWRATQHPDNAAYILRNIPVARAGLQAFRALCRDEATLAFHRVARLASAGGERTLT